MVKLEEGERILFIARRHWFLFLGQIIFILFFAVLPLFLLFIPSSVFAPVRAVLPGIEFTVFFFTFFWSLWLMMLLLAFASLWTTYSLDIWLITNYRIIDIEQVGLFNRDISSFRLDQIQDATVKVSGIIATLIGFGSVEVRTASNESFKFDGVACPNELKERIMSEQHRVRA